MMAVRRRVRTRLGDVDLTQPIDIGGSLSTYYPSSSASDLMLPTPPVLSQSGTGVPSNVALTSLMSAENIQAQQAAARQGFISSSDFGYWLQQNAGLVIGGAVVVGAFAFFMSGGRRR